MDLKNRRRRFPTWQLRGWQWAAAVVAVMTLPFRSGAFSLLGPPEPWMNSTIGYQLPGDIGGPMNVGEGYRWNIPVITYGFDHSFTEYFGSNGVAAVESAIAVLNALPPASSMDLSQYPAQPWHVNPVAASARLVDVKTMALQLLLEQLGLADPTRWVFTIHDYYSLPPNSTNYVFTVIKRNFDPADASPSSFVNGGRYSYFIQEYIRSNAFSCVALPFLSDPLARRTAAANLWSLFYGEYLEGLSPDDAGGIRYLLSGNRVAFENLLPDVHALGTNSVLVRAAYRPGVEKITFVRFPFSPLSGQFGTFTNRWTDIFYDWDSVYYQDVERVTTRPDILFSARDLGGNLVDRTGTTNWENNAALNGNPSGAGPGIIRPPVTLTFTTGGPQSVNIYNPGQILNGLSESTASTNFWWASFDSNTNGFVTYPRAEVLFPSTNVRLDLVVESATNMLHWTLAGAAYGRFYFQSSTNLANWTTVTTLTNSGVPFDFSYTAPAGESRRFFRTIQAN
jgi:hypothetical protein